MQVYRFDRNGNRNSLTRRDPAADGSCATSGGTATSYTYDSADRLATASGYVYDGLGRATTIPAAHTPAGLASGTGLGDLVIGYHDTDAVRSLTQNGTTTTYDLDVSGRREVATTGPTGGQPVRTVTRHYTDTSDNPGWVEETTGGAATITRYLEALAGNLTLEITDQGQVTLPVADLHGDVNTTITVPADSNEPATGINGWVDTDEYGNPLAGAARNGDVAGVLRGPPETATWPAS